MLTNFTQPSVNNLAALATGGALTGQPTATAATPQPFTQDWRQKTTLSNTGGNPLLGNFYDMAGITGQGFTAEQRLGPEQEGGAQWSTISPQQLHYESILQSAGKGLKSDPNYVFSPQEYMAWSAQPYTAQTDLAAYTKQIREIIAKSEKESEFMGNWGFLLPLGAAAAAWAFAPAIAGAGAAGTGGALGGIDAGIGALGEIAAADAAAGMVPQFGTHAGYAAGMGSGLGGGLGGAGGAFDMGGSAGVFDSFGNPLYNSPTGLPGGSGMTEILKTENPLYEVVRTEGAKSGGLLGNLPSGLQTALKMPWGMLANLAQMITGGTGLSSAGNIRDAGAAATAANNPFGPWRAGYAQDLFNLMNDPSSIENRPGYKSGLRARARALAAQGLNPGVTKDGVGLVPGRFGYEMDKYGGDFLNQELQRLMILSGATFPPNGGQFLLQGEIGATNLQGQSLQSMLAGLYGLLTGGSSQGSGTPWWAFA